MYRNLLAKTAKKNHDVAMIRLLATLAIILILPSVWAENNSPSLRIAATHPIIGAMIQKLGGDHVTVTSLIRMNGSLHQFDPTPTEMARLQGTRILFACGKGLEPYLPRINDNLHHSNPTYECVLLGTIIPDVPAACDDDHEHDGGHSHGASDPHWWHSPSNMKRAARAVYAKLCALDPKHEAYYKTNLTHWQNDMDGLTSWASIQIAAIPPQNRILVTEHASMGHFCAAFGFKEIPIHGINQADEGNAADIAATLRQLRDLHVTAIFPDMSSSQKMLQEIASSVGIKIGPPLITDGLSPQTPDFESMFRHNVTMIAQALAPHTP